MVDERALLDAEVVREITRSQTALRSYIWKMVGNYHDAEDILQKVNSVVWTKRTQWDSSTAFLKWAYRIAFFQVKAHLRDCRRNRLVFDDDVVEALATDRPHFKSMDALQEALRKCLERMDRKNRDLLLKRYQEGGSFEDLARSNDHTPNSLSQLLRRLRIKLSDCIGKQIRQANWAPEG